MSEVAGARTGGLGSHKLCVQRSKVLMGQRGWRASEGWHRGCSGCQICWVGTARVPPGLVASWTPQTEPCFSSFPSSSHSGIPQPPSSWACTGMLPLSPSAQIWDEAAQSSSPLPCGNSVVQISANLSITLHLKSHCFLVNGKIGAGYFKC